MKTEAMKRIKACLDNPDGGQILPVIEAELAAIEQSLAEAWNTRADEATRSKTIEECVSFIVGNTPFEGCNGCVQRLIDGIRSLADRDATQEAIDRIGGG